MWLLETLTALLYARGADHCPQTFEIAEPCFRVWFPTACELAGLGRHRTVSGHPRPCDAVPARKPSWMRGTCLARPPPPSVRAASPTAAATAGHAAYRHLGVRTRKGPAKGRCSQPWTRARAGAHVERGQRRRRGRKSGDRPRPS